MAASGTGRPIDLVCFSHLRWDFVFQRPQHLMSRAAHSLRVFYVEEPHFADGAEIALHTRLTAEDVMLVQTNLPWHCDHAGEQRRLLDRLVAEHAITNPVLWFYTPRALEFAGHLRGRATVYDCMDELSAFAGADGRLPEQERALLARADTVFTGGASLFEAKRPLHGNVHLFPSAVDSRHFAPARTALPDPADQAHIPHPRAGFYGVLDERLDRALVAGVARLRPGVQFVLLGPLAKLDESELPRAPNLHYLPGKSYGELPGYIANWDVATLPFARNEATRYISPTKTPEYLAAGCPVVSTPIMDVVRTYGALEAVHVGGTAEEFACGIDLALAQARDGGAWRDEADAAIAPLSWDVTWARMRSLLPRPPAPAVMRRAHYDVVVVGAGFAGSVMAERLAVSGQRVLLADRRPHLGGNAHDTLDAAGVRIHPYGPHIFHTNCEEVVTYLSRFTAWRRYEHRVLAAVRGELLPIPINPTTVNRFFGLQLRPEEVGPFLAARAETREPVRTAEDVVLSTVGRELYEAFFEGYTRKQWGVGPAELDRSVTARVPTRANDDDRYFLDSFQAMPRDGFAPMFRRMVDHPGIDIALETEWRELANRGSHLVFTGPVDEYFGHRYGALPYRSLRFRHETHASGLRQPVAVINYPDPAVPHTRVTEFRHLTGQAHTHTSLCTEYPAAEGDPYYPVPRPENAALYRRYQALADASPDVTFVGRLATYRYYNMDQVVAQALATHRRLMERRAVAD